MVNLTRTLANDWGRHNVTVNALAPGDIETAALREKEYTPLGMTAEHEVLHRQAIPAHRAGTPEEVAEICAFLCSPAARFINGAAIIADGGQSLHNWVEMPGWDMERP